MRQKAEAQALGQAYEGFITEFKLENLTATLGSPVINRPANKIEPSTDQEGHRDPEAYDLTDTEPARTME